MSMTMILLAVSVGCNLWFLFLLLYDRIMDTKIARFFKGIVKVWRSLEETEKGRQTAHTKLPASDNDIMGKSRFKMASTRTNAAIPVQEAAISEKGIELSEEEATFDDGKSCRLLPKRDGSLTGKPPPIPHKSRRTSSKKPSRA